MWLRKTGLCWMSIFQNRFRALPVMICLSMAICAGCGNRMEGTKENAELSSEDNKKSKITDESKALAEGYREIYEDAKSQESLNSLETQQKIVAYMGESGYTAVDRDDQINMVNHGKVESFCESAAKKHQDQVTIFSVLDDGGFVRYDLETEQGSIEVTVSTLRWYDREPDVCYYHEFTAYSWKYTEKGYLFIEEYHPAGYDGAPGEIAFRVKPLDQKCREFSRKYVYPVGYVRNNLFITDWNEQDYSKLDFYDLYEKLYEVKYNQYVPYEAYEGAEYEVPEIEFEDVIQSYFHIGKDQLREKTVYHSETKTYRYRPRGLKDAEQPYEPYPEVVSYESQEDGTIRLFIEAVWERKMTDHAVTSELVVRPLEDGSFQYVSNQVTGWDDNLEIQWYTARLTDDEWQYYYKESTNEQQ